MRPFLRVSAFSALQRVTAAASGGVSPAWQAAAVKVHQPQHQSSSASLPAYTLLDLPSNFRLFCSSSSVRMSSAPTYLFRQLFEKESSTYTYLLADVNTREAVLIDPVIEVADRDAKLVEELDLKLKYVMNTHVHADHITGTGRLKKLVPGCQSVLSAKSGGKADVLVKHGEVIKFGEHELEVAETPGHTQGCITYICKKAGTAFTGDALLIRGCGRTDFQGGSSATLYKSVWDNILSLPDSTVLYPAHDYKGQTATTVLEEKKFNPRLTKTLVEFEAIMAGLNLPYPKKIDESLPPNNVCGLHDLPERMQDWV